MPQDFHRYVHKMHRSPLPIQRNTGVRYGCVLNWVQVIATQSGCSSKDLALSPDCTGTGNLDTGLRVTLLRFLRHPRLSSDEYGGMGVMPIEHHALSSSDEPDCGIP